jgi:hypothetical protein
MILFLISFLTTSLAYAENFRVEGRVLERGTRTPLANVNVFALPSKKKATSDENGNFIFEFTETDFEKKDSNRFSIQWVINTSNYIKLESVDEFTLDSSSFVRTFYLEKDSYLTYETTIFGDQRVKESKKTLKRSEFLNAAGSGGDALRAVQNLPGVNRPASFSSQVIIQGSGPQETQYLLQDHNVPLVFHFGGLSSIMIPEAVDHIDLYQAGYGAEYGRALGGLVSIWARPPQTDRAHGVVFVDTLNAGGLIEAPTGKDSGVLFSARQSYIGEVLRRVLKNNDSFNLTVAPNYSDSTLVYKNKLTDKDDFEVVGFGSRDSLEFLFKQPVEDDPEIRGTFETSTSFFRFIPSLTHRHSDSTISKYSLGIGRDFIKVLTNDNYFRLKTYQITTRGEVEHTFSDSFQSYLGWDNRYTWAQVQVKIPAFYASGGVANPLSSGTTRQADIGRRSSVIGIYSRNEFKPDSEKKWILSPNFRIDRFSTTEDTTFSPRPSIVKEINENWSLHTSGGLYFQPPQEQEVDNLYGNPELETPRAWHLNTGFEFKSIQSKSSGIKLTTDTFYKRLEKLVVPSSRLINKGGTLAAENFNNTGSGYAYGIQNQFRIETYPWSFSIIYTLSRSIRSELGQRHYPAPYDQTHLIGLLSSLQLGKNWTLSTRFRYATGNPTTPVVDSVFDADNDTYIPIRGQYYSDRLPDFYQLDFRVDKKWAFDTWILSAYLDVLNLTNRRNVEALVYSADYKKSADISGIPVFPTIGLKGEF